MMITGFKGNTSEVQLNTGGPFTIIDEEINPAGSKRIAIALRKNDLDTVLAMAKSRVEAGATCAIPDPPLKTITIKAADPMMGHDPFILFLCVVVGERRTGFAKRKAHPGLG